MERRHQRKSHKQFWMTFLSGIQSKSWKTKIGMACLLILALLFLTINILIWTSDVSELETPVPQPTIIYDQNGEIASKVSNSKIKYVPLDQIPEHVIEAVIATEDQQFYDHNGVNYFGILRAAFRNIKEGEIVAGGSTITQQLAKNVFLTHEQTFTRKFKEYILTKKIERTYSKDEILERYLNHIYYGEGAWGIQQASQIYFGKDVSDLTLSESATLAGLIKSPSNLSPMKNMEESMERRNTVLALMLEEGYITEKEWERAEEQRLVVDGKKMKDEYDGKYSYYVDHIIEEASERYELTEAEILSGGLRIYTELNPTIQQAMEKVFGDDTLFPESPSDQLVQSGGVFLDPSTGGISALVGGRGEHVYRGFNRATQLVRQPGSTMKPLAVYTPALEQGYEMDDQLVDRPIDIGGYEPQNYDRQFRGEVTMYDAVVHSYNVPAVWLLNKMGVAKGIDALERFDIPLEEGDHNLGIALGGMEKGTSPLVMAQAYSTFPNNGEMVKAHAITKIVDSNGEVLGEWEEKATKVTDPEVAQKISYMLRGVVSAGSGKNAQVDGFEIAGKTGTTEFVGSDDGAKDHWFVGYTAEVVGAIWLGFDQTDENHFLTSSSGSTAAVIFGQIISNSRDAFSQKKLDLSLVGKMEEKEQKVKESGSGKKKGKEKKPKGKKKEKKDKGKGKKKGKEEI